MVFFVVVGLLLIAIAWSIGTYNGLVVSKAAVRKAFLDLELQLQRQFDLNKRLLDAVKGQQGSSQERLFALSSAREAVLEALQVAKESSYDVVVMDAVVQAQAVLDGLLAELRQAVEAGVSGLDDPAVQPLLSKLVDAEAFIVNAKGAYNDAVLAYNSKLEQFPGNLVADWFDFEEAAVYENAAD